MLLLLLASASAAAAASLTLSPYTVSAPKKVVLNQVRCIAKLSSIHQLFPACFLGFACTSKLHD